VTALVAIAGHAILFSLVALNLAASVLIIVGAQVARRDRHHDELVDVGVIASSELTTALSLIVPVRGVQRDVVAVVRSLLESDYPALEVIVVDDGSADGAIEALREAFSLVTVERVPRSRLRTRRVLRAYASALDARLLVLDKELGGRADALNTGLRFARYPLVCPVDPHVTLDRDALARMARAFQTSPETIVCGAATRIAQAGRSPLARLQSLGRSRDSLLWRAAAGRLGGQLFARDTVAVFSREAVVAAGGYAPSTPGEDLELVLRLHRHLLDAGRRYRIVALPRPAASCAVTAGLRAAAQQSHDARRARGAALAAHRGMFLRRRYGLLGCLVLPALALWSLVRRPLVLVVGCSMVAGAALGTVDPGLTIVELVLLASAPLGLSLAAALLEHPSREPSRPLAATLVHAPR
jgi:cellulose synthase/poly-beta-1,6-N-acetylglucosamine synthase-like glycosyltransferase